MELFTIRRRIRSFEPWKVEAENVLPVVNDAEEFVILLVAKDFGVFLMTKHAVPHLKTSCYASIVNFSSIYGLVGSN